ncbi:MAG: N-6 DNA methylase [Chloroflexi bacterium]|nr:N-6 DNA methylase [Chloroflexota bacterium]
MPHSLEDAKRLIGERVEVFARNREQYRHPDYKEARLRREFLDPFFGALGWDVDNSQGHAEQYKEVVNEDAVKVAGTTKAPDYAFRIGGVRKFFAEAKKPGVTIQTDASAAYQLRRYAWSAQLPLSILSDFEELAIYDCRARPSDKDKASVGRINFFTFDQYLDRLPEIYDVFSKQAVLRGSFDRYVQETRGKRGTTPVDAEFLKEIEGWRTALAKNIALLNPRLSLDELNDAVQRTIDRIIFLRMAEDRGAEEYGRLLALTPGPSPVAKAATGEGRIYKRLLELCRAADGKYNSGLFDFTLDTLTPRLKIDDDKLRAILGDLYYPQSPYEFSVLAADTLGSVYEQFLGKVIRLTPAHQAKIEEKPEVKKAGGVYYTPPYIVDYIVKQTVGKLIEGKSPDEIESLRVLDPACGSGSFLLGAYELLLKYHLDWYLANPGEYANRVYESATGWRLTTAEKKRILLNNIFGVDIDRQAVEVTKLSLLLKVLEGETQETLGQQLSLFREPALPNLDANIRCGNALIGTDYFAGQLLPDADELRRVNPFDWERAFPTPTPTFPRSQNHRTGEGDGGFDCVIGNPPYGAEIGEKQHAYLREKFRGESRSYDSYELFLLTAKRLLRHDGRISMIIPASWLTGEKYQESRRKLVTELFPVVAYAMPFDVFKEAYIDTAIVVLSSVQTENCTIHFFPKKQRLISVPDDIGESVPIANIRGDTQHRLSIALSQNTAPLLQKVTAPSTKFGDWFDISRGVQPYSRSKHTEEQIASRFLHATSKKSRQYLPELQGSELSRYFIDPERKSYLKYSEEIASTRPMRMFAGRRIVLRRLLTRKFRLQASLATETLITTDNVLNMVARVSNASPEFALAILNSKLISWVYVNTSMIAQKDDFPQVHISALSEIRLTEYDKACHDRMVALVTQMLQLHARLAAAQTAADRELLQRQIDATDAQIDALVYQMYGLTEEEIKVVEGEG